MARFSVDAERRLLQLHRALVAGAYRPGPYRLHLIHEPKLRLIAAAPVVDRVVHHALHRVLAPELDRSLIEHTYACIPGRGSHRAVLAFASALRRHPFVLMLDIRHYFPSIRPRVLLSLLERRLRGKALLELCAHILEAGAEVYRPAAVREALGLDPQPDAEAYGLPIGNLTSQWWANHYLSALDHWLQRELHIPHVQRYMDDLALFADDPARLVEARAASAEFLDRERGLRLKHPEAPVQDTRQCFDYLGYRIDRFGIRASRAAFTRAERRLASLARAGDQARVERSWAALHGWLGFGRVARDPR